MLDLRAQVDAASLGAFRALFGLVMAASTARFVAHGWVEELYLAPTYHFRYEFAPFVRALPAPAMYGLFAVQFAAALCLAVGLCSRVAAAAFFVAFTYVELIDRAYYLNHYYLVSLLALLLALSPAGGTYAVDAYLWKGRRVDRVPRWLLATLRAQIAVVYVFAGLAKLERDWLVDAQPLTLWLGAHGAERFVGPLLGSSLTAHAASVLGAMFDLAVVPLLCVRATRPWAFAAALLFHAITGWLLPIGMFPCIMAVGLTLFLPADWPRGLLGPRPTAPRAYRAPRGLGLLFAAHVAVQVAVPLERHLAHPDSAWTGEGFDFAWKVMLVEKSGVVTFTLRDQSGREETIHPERWLNGPQCRALAQSPWLVRQFARDLARSARARGRDVSVTADARASLNGRPARPLVRPDADLVRAERDWLTPFP